MFNLKKSAQIIIFYVCSTFLISSSSLAKTKKESPLKIAGATTITADELIGLVEKYQHIVIIDSRMHDRPQGYIEDSINLPDIETNCKTLAGVLEQKNSPSIFYCNGPKCRRSEKAIKVALECGYSHIYWYREGFEDWLQQGFPYIVN